jgi:hypothetical protein
MSRWMVPEHFKVMIGGNTYIDCPVIIDYNGQSLFELRRSDTDGYLGINFDLYGSDGKRVGTVRNAQFVPPRPEGYSVRHGADHYVLTEDATGRTICDIKLRQKAQDDAEIEVAAEMYMPDGFLLRFTPEQTNFGGSALRGNIFRNLGADIKIS